MTLQYRVLFNAHRNHHGRKRSLGHLTRHVRSAGHRAGAKTVESVVEAAARHRANTLTLYAFSSDNWQRPAAEVAALFTLFRRYLLTQTQQCIEQAIRINVIGRRDRLASSLRSAIERSEALTAGCSGMLLRLAVDYSSRYTILEAAQHGVASTLSDDEQFSRAISATDLSVACCPSVALVIRTGGEKRLSDFLLWECGSLRLELAGWSRPSSRC